jgi:hypothetical protein
MIRVTDSPSPGQPQTNRHRPRSRTGYRQSHRPDPPGDTEGRSGGDGPEDGCRGAEAGIGDVSGVLRVIRLDRVSIGLGLCFFGEAVRSVRDAPGWGMDEGGPRCGIWDGGGQIRRAQDVAWTIAG